MGGVHHAIYAHQAIQTDFFARGQVHKFFVVLGLQILYHRIDRIKLAQIGEILNFGVFFLGGQGFQYIIKAAIDRAISGVHA